MFLVADGQGTGEVDVDALAKTRSTLTWPGCLQKRSFPAFPCHAMGLGVWASNKAVFVRLGEFQIIRPDSPNSDSEGPIRLIKDFFVNIGG